MSTKKASKKATPKSDAKASSYTSKRNWKLTSANRWPPPDNPMMRHDDTEADLGIATEGLAEMRLAGELGSLIRVDKGIGDELHRGAAGCLLHQQLPKSNHEP